MRHTLSTIQTLPSGRKRRRSNKIRKGFERGRKHNKHMEEELNQGNQLDH